MAEQLDKVLSKLDNIQKDITELKVENAKQTASIEINTKDLTEHKEGVIQNRCRIVSLEKQEAKLGMIWKVILGIGSLAGVMFAVIRLLPKLGV